MPVSRWKVPQNIQNMTLDVLLAKLIRHFILIELMEEGKVSIWRKIDGVVGDATLWEDVKQVGTPVLLREYLKGILIEIWVWLDWVLWEELRRRCVGLLAKLCFTLQELHLGLGLSLSLCLRLFFLLLSLFLLFLLYIFLFIRFWTFCIFKLFNNPFILFNFFLSPSWCWLFSLILW